MKNKIAALLLVLCMMLSCGLFAACGEVKDVDINAAIEKTEALDSISADVSMQISVSTEGIKMEIPITALVNVNGANQDSPEIYTKMSTTLLGQSVEMEMYQADGWVYTVMGDMKYKVPAEEASSEFDYSENVDEILQVIPEELLKDVDVKKNSDGSQTVDIALSGEKFTEYYADILDAVSSQTGFPSVGAEISDATVSITVANGYVTVYDIGFKMSVEVEGVANESEVRMTVKFNNPGKDVTVTPPEGYKDFEEFNASDIFGGMTDEDLYGEDGDLSDIYGDVTDGLDDSADNLDDMLSDLDSLFE